MSAACFLSFSIFERRGIVKYNQFKQEKKGALNIKLLLERDIVKFSFVSVLTGIVRTSVVFWLPTYIAQYLGFTPKTAAGIFTGASLIISVSAIIAVFIYEKMGRNRDCSLFWMFLVSFIFFILTYFVDSAIPNIVFIVLAITAADCASSILWSVYCPSLRDTGMVSSATGFLDFLSYMAAAAANLIFANSVNIIGWKNLILIWCALGALGVMVAIPYKKIFKKHN